MYAIDNQVCLLSRYVYCVACYIHQEYIHASSMLHVDQGKHGALAPALALGWLHCVLTEHELTAMCGGGVALSETDICHFEGAKLRHI